MHKSMRLGYEPSSEPLHISVKQLFSNCAFSPQQLPQGRSDNFRKSTATTSGSQQRRAPQVAQPGPASLAPRTALDPHLRRIRQGPLSTEFGRYKTVVPVLYIRQSGLEFGPGFQVVVPCSLGSGNLNPDSLSPTPQIARYFWLKSTGPSVNTWP